MKKRMTNKLIRTLTALSMIIALIVPATGASAELGIKNELQVSLLAAFGIVPGYPSSYNADAPVNSEDFVQYAYRLKGVEISDVSAIAESYGLDADSSVTSMKAVEIVLDAIDYGNAVFAYGNSYIKMAESVGLLNGTGISTTSVTTVTYDNMVMLFYNALNLNALEYSFAGSYSERDETVMEYYLDVYKSKGVVNANSLVAIDGGETTANDSVRIDDKVYLKGYTTVDALIGTYVDFYYRDDDINGEDTIAWIETNTSKTTSLTVYGNDVTEVTESIIYYDEGSKNKTAKLDGDVVIIYNGKTVTDGAVGLEAVSSPNAETRFIDNDSTGKYNIAIIYDYVYYYIDAVTSDTYTVSDYTSQTSIELNSEYADDITVYENGAAADLSAVTVGKIAAVSISLDGTVIRVEILTGTVSGEITAVDSDYVTISGEKCLISPSYAGDELSIGKYGTFYFDRYGRVVRCAGMKESSSQYGYLLTYYNDGDPEDGDYYAKIFTAEGTTEIFAVQKNITLDGTKRSASNAAEYIEKKQLITYKLNSANKITRIDMPNKNYVGVDDSTNDFSLHFKGSGKYRKNNMCFNSKYLIDSTTPIFLIPQSGEVKDYAIIYASSLTNNTTYDISVYDIDDYMYASCIVMKENFTEPENLRTKRAVIITEMYQGINEDSEPVIIIEGYRQGSNVTFTVDNLSMMDNRGKYYVSDLNRGDIIQVGESATGEVSAVQLLFKADEETLAIAAGTDETNSYWEGGSSVMPDLWVSYGRVTDRSSTVLLVDADGDDTVTSKDPHKFGTATTVYLYENGNVYSSSASEISLGDYVYVQEYQGNLQEIMIVR